MKREAGGVTSQNLSDLKCYQNRTCGACISNFHKKNYHPSEIRTLFQCYQYMLISNSINLQNTSFSLIVRQDIFKQHQVST